MCRAPDCHPCDQSAHLCSPHSSHPLLLSHLQGWRFNGKGECTKMPSTVLTRGVAGKQMGEQSEPDCGLCTGQADAEACVPLSCSNHTARLTISHASPVLLPALQ